MTALFGKGIGAAERVEMSPRSPWWGEHRSRYHYAASYALGKKVLDVACGTGYGVEILSDAGADWVVGADRALDILVNEGASTPEETALCAGDAVRLPFRDSSFELITSFETIEHLSSGESFLREVRRVLEPGGTLVLSTPNATHTDPIDGKPRNPFHVHEFYPQELIDLALKHFESVRLLGQRSVPPSPFWEPRVNWPRDLQGRVGSAWWRVKHRLLPFALKDGLNRLFHNRSFYPGEYDFRFLEEDPGRAHVLMIVCS